jgi:calcium-independent phospholipase A2-gamma
MDGGGTRALATVCICTSYSLLILTFFLFQLEILKKMEEMTGQRVCDMFDIIAGTSTGGILASLIGIRGYSLERCETLYKDLSSKVFAIGNNPGKLT